MARALPQCDDSDDVSSTEDCLNSRAPNIRGEGTSSTSTGRVRPHHRPPRHMKHGLLSLHRGDSELNVREAMRAMQALCQRVANQKMLVIQSLEDDCGKQELNEQIAVSIDGNFNLFKQVLHMRGNKFCDVTILTCRFCKNCKSSTFVLNWL